MNIYIDRMTGKAVLSLSPLTYSVTVNDDFSLTKVIEVQDGEKQKTNEEGRLLYKINTFENEEVGEVWSETIEPNDNPVMVDNMIQKTVTLSENPTEFTVEEILQAKYQTLLEGSTYDYILADIFLDESDIDLADPNHTANTGVAILQLLPKGQAKTKAITLEVAAKTFELLEFEGPGAEVYINDVKFIDNKATLSDSAEEITIKFVNTTDKPVDIKSYAIAY